MSSRPESTLARLDLPTDARALLITCDDLGLHGGTNAGILDALHHGLATSCSLMTPAAACAAAMDTLAARPEVDFGVHLTLVSDFQARPTRPISPPERVPSLVDETGCFLAQSAIPELLTRADVDDVRREIEAQLGVVLRRGLQPSHLDWHCLADGGRPDLLEATVALAEEHGLAVRIWLDPGRELARRRGRPVVDHPFLDSFALDPASKQASLERALHDLPIGLTEWAVHPSTDSPDVRDLDPGWPVRISDLRFLTSDRAAEIVRDEGIVLVDYPRLQRAWALEGERA